MEEKMENKETKHEESEKRAEKKVEFFIDKERYTSEEADLTVRTLLVDFAKEDSAQTTLVYRHGNDEPKKYTNLDEIIHLENGMKFLVYHNGPTPVS
jgi:hypothetical protein